MAVAEPRSITNAYLKARYELEKSTTSNNMILAYIVAKNRSDKQLIEVYDFDKEKHNMLFNGATINFTGGCGCKWCKSLQRYVQSRLYLHKFKKSYYEPYGVSSGLTLFNDKYHWFLKNNETELTEEEFFEAKINEFKREIQQLRIVFISIRDAINTLLEV